MREYGIERAVRDARLGPIGGGTDEIMKEILGKQLGLAVGFCFFFTHRPLTGPLSYAARGGAGAGAATARGDGTGQTPDEPGTPRRADPATRSGLATHPPALGHARTKPANERGPEVQPPRPTLARPRPPPTSCSVRTTKGL